MRPHVELCSPEEARRILALLGDDPKLWNEKMLHGHVDAVCREADGSVAWEIHQPNVITDVGRRYFAEAGFITTYIFSSPSNETPSALRYSLFDDGAASSSRVSTTITPTYDSVTYTKSWLNTFTAPGTFTRTIGTIGLCNYSAVASGLGRLYAYTALSPIKYQTATQTLEVTYKITLTPVY